VREFEGVGRGMIIAPGAHKITVSLPGYQTFETEINALPKQKVEVKTNLLRTNENTGASDSLMKSGSNNHATIPPPDPLPPPHR
jgi:PEGA domain